MKYMLLIYGDPTYQMTDADFQAGRAGHIAFQERLRQEGSYVGGDALSPVQTATTIRSHAGKPLITDGPFAETTEVLGGYYIVDVANLDAATTVASMIPGVREGYQTVEIRPILVMG